MNVALYIGMDANTNIKQENKINNTLNEFLRRLKNASNLTFDDLEGLIDGPEDVDSYIENAENNLFYETSKELGWSLDELEEWHKKNWI